MQKLLFLTVLFLSCSPAQIATTGLNAVSADGAVCILERKSSSTVQVSVNDIKPMQDAALRLDGRNISSSDARCAVSDGGLGCKLGTVTSAVVSVNASSGGGSVSFYRNGSDTPYLALCAVRR